MVSPNWAEATVRALQAKEIPVVYLAFEGEDHGFRKAENVERAFATERTFYGRVFSSNRPTSCHRWKFIVWRDSVRRGRNP
jgi:dipeptidyl aminopeptidase/acylaminoacyl peptidase